MTKTVLDLIVAGEPLPVGTRIKTTCGGVHTGGQHELPSYVLESANRVPNINSEVEPFWISGWRDLHGDLVLPEIHDDE